MQPLQSVLQRFSFKPQPVPPPLEVRPDDLFELGCFYIGNTSFVVSEIDDNRVCPNLRVFQRQVGSSERHSFYASVDLKTGQIKLDKDTAVGFTVLQWADKVRRKILHSIN